MSIRFPVVAGTNDKDGFYPGSKKALLAELQRCIPVDAKAEKAVGLLVPHAGYVYSGATAGKTYASAVIPDRVAVLAVNHKRLGKPLAVWAAGSWETPLGSVAVDEELAWALLKACPAAADDEVAHLYEHSLEVQLPFIQKLNPEAKVLPVCLAIHADKALQEFGEALAGVVRASGSEVLVVASGDMTHYEPAAVAREKDGLVIDRVKALDPEGLLSVVRRRATTVCGSATTAAMLWAAKALGARSAELVEYSHSGQAIGDDAEVVGYAGVVVR